MMIVYVSIGNSDDKLTQELWSHYCSSVDGTIQAYAKVVHGAWYSLPSSAWQNACWCFEVTIEEEGNLRDILRRYARKFHQNSISWAEVETQEFLEAAA